MNKERRAFHRGMLAALAVIHSRDLPTLYREIIDTTDLSELILVATGDDQMAFSGLEAFLNRQGLIQQKEHEDGSAAEKAARRHRRHRCD